ncbi:unnamed protein product [Rangifer tarandus platyrhynchus]|uniref:Uncharacterized protein n=2 Tax=Rangifer tarandus platyrhynchus TaxID=3082113 RepID=A0AC59Y9N4_RANTA|nr:unnamed protein product [Rangifer tarandus platyrhynchus]
MIQSSQSSQSSHLRVHILGFPDGLVVGNSPASVGDTGSILGSRRSHMPGSNEACETQILSQCSKAQEPQLLEPMHLEPMVCKKQGWCTKPGKWPLLAATRESLCVARKT